MVHHMARVTVVMAVYNGERFLAEALDSVFAQTFQDFDVICVDDGSTDRSLEILSKYEPRVVVLKQRNAGPCAARNEAVRNSKAPYVAFVDQDDRWYPWKLERQVGVLEAQPDAVLVLSNSDRIDENGRLLQTGATLAERSSLSRSPLGRLMGTDLLLPSAILVRRNAFVEAGMYDSLLHGFEDFDLDARLRPFGRFVFLEDPALAYRVHGQGFSRTGSFTVIKSRERFLIKMRELYAGDPEKQALIRTMLAECYSDWGIAEVRAGHPREGRQRLLQSLREDPLKLRTHTRLLRSFWTSERSGK